jgi:D-ribose pyranase
VRKDGLLHAELLDVLAAMGHGDTIVVADAGLPIPASVRRIDLAVAPGTPSFLDVLRAVCGAGVFEAVTVAEELRERDDSMVEAIVAAASGMPLDSVSHTRLKELSAEAVAVVRTGEFTPYANAILRAGVPF